jgi:hypothetical protein
MRECEGRGGEGMKPKKKQNKKMRRAIGGGRWSPAEQGESAFAKERRKVD